MYQYMLLKKLTCIVYQVGNVMVHLFPKHQNHLIIITIFFIFIFFGITSPLSGEKNALTSESYPLSEIPRTLLKMKVVPSSAAFCKQLITMGIPLFFRWFISSSLTAPKAPATTGITVALTFHNICTCSLKSWYLVIFSSSFTLTF